MKRILLRVAYEGTDYAGWQVQPGQKTIESVLNENLSQLLGEDIVVIGASRTDSGVHSCGNVAVFDTNTSIPPEKISFAVNQRLPKDIVVWESKEVAGDFHPRKCASRKTYEYRILNRTFPDPLKRKDTYFYYRKLDLESMQEAAHYLEGIHDFAAFCSAHSQAKDSVREIYFCTVTRQEDVITIRVTGNGFLYNMVRIIAGTLIEVGNGDRSPGDLPAILEGKDRTAAGPTAPACGLTMMGIEFL